MLWCARAGANFQSHQPTKCHWEMVQWIPSYCRDSDRVRECAGIWVHPTLHWITNQLVTNIGATLKIFLSFVFCESCQLCVTWSIFELNLFVCHQHPGEKWYKSLRSMNDPPWNASQWMTVQDVLNHLEGPPWSITRQSKGFWGPSPNISSSSTHILELKGPWYRVFFLTGTPLKS